MRLPGRERNESGWKQNYTWVKMEDGGMQGFEGDEVIGTWLMKCCEGKFLWGSRIVCSIIGYLKP